MSHITSKKAQGISLETIIIAVISLVVLIVLYFIFTGKLNLWGSDVDKNTKGGKCTDTTGPTNTGKGTWEYTCSSNKYSWGFIYSDSNEHVSESCCFTKVGPGQKCTDNDQCTNDKCTNGICLLRTDVTIRDPNAERVA